jgi:ferric-dicitrate binding protein FerR (iron transport regulator)
VASRELEELLGLHFDGNLAAAETEADVLEARLASDACEAERFAGLIEVEGLLRARAANAETTERLTKRVMRAVASEGSHRRFTQGVMSGLPQLRRSRRLPRLLAAAAVLLIVAGSAWFFTRPGTAGTITSAGSELVGSPLAYGQQLRTAEDQNLSISLADGSLLGLLPATSASVPRRREIRLACGKITLKCKADRSNPFSVHARGTEARAVGTEFTVAIKEEEKAKMKPTVVVSIIAGLVLVTNDWGHLEAGEGKTVISVKGKPPALLTRPNTTTTVKKTRPPKATGGLAKSVNFQFAQSPLDECCKYFAGLTELKISCDAGIARTRISLSMIQVPTVSAIRWLARLSGARAFELPDKSIVITRTKPKNGTELLYEADDSEEWKKEIEKKLKKKVSFEFVQAPLSEAVNFLQQVSNINMVTDPALGKKKDAPVTLKMTTATLKLSLTWILKMAGCEYELLDHALFIKLAGPRKVAKTEISKKLRAALARKVSLEFVEMPLEECIAYCKGLATVNIIVDPKAFAAGRVDRKTSITLRLTKVSLQKTLETITRMAGLRIEYRKGDVIYITQGTKRKPKPASKPKPKPEVF